MPAVAELRKTISGVFVQPRSVEGQLARNTGWTVAGTVSSQGSSLLSALVIGRLLGVAPLGKLALVQATILMLGSVAEMGMALTTTKFVSRWRTADPARAGRLLGWTLRTAAGSGVLIAVSVATLIPWLGIGGLSGVTTELRAACGVLLFDMLNRIQLGALSGLESFDRSARVQASRGVLLLPGVYLGARLGGLIGAVAAMSCVSFTVFMIGHRILRKRCRELKIPICFRGAREPGVASTSLSLWAGALLLSGSTWAVTLMLTRETGGFSQVGLYNAADKWKTALTYLPNMLFQVTLPMLSHRQAAGDRNGCRRIFHIALGSTLAVTGTAALAVTALSRVLMSSYGSGFTAGAHVLALLSVGAVAGAVYTVGSSVLWALGKPAQMLGVDIFKTSLLLILCWAGLASSAQDLALAYVLAFSIAAVVILLAVRRQFGAKQWSA
jgi:O-antigen/teichoic acid export membrane protein